LCGIFKLREATVQKWHGLVLQFFYLSALQVCSW